MKEDIYLPVWVCFVCVVGGCVWSSENLRVSMLCALWLKAAADDLLLCGGFDQRLRLWRKQRGHEDALTLTGVFGVQKGAVLALNQNSTHVASASGQYAKTLKLGSWSAFCNNSDVLRETNHALTSRWFHYTTLLLIIFPSQHDTECFVLYIVTYQCSHVTHLEGKNDQC